MFQINGISWNVVFVPASSSELMRSDGSRTVGMTDWNQKTVFVSRSLYGPFLRKVLIHEICHTAVFSYGIELNIEQEEFLCDFIASYGDEIFGVVDELFRAIKRIA